MVEVVRRTKRDRTHQRNRVQSDWVSSTELRARMGWSYQTLTTMLAKGLPHYQPTRKYTFNLREVDAWMEKFRRGDKV